ncbi:MAG: prenyltransferase/squalene oxidase repeat-containing protein [Planctomycetota bacterium]
MRLFALTLLALSLSLGATRAQDSDFGARRSRALDKGIEWLKKQQQPDGTWDYDDKPFAIAGLKHMVSGCTALACYALLKAGVEPTDGRIDKAFGAIRKAPLEQTYAVGCILLAIEARYNWEPPFWEERRGEGTVEKGPGPRKVAPPGPDMDLAKKCVEFLVKTQRPEGSWRYEPSAGSPAQRNDASHPQYALLGLDAAERIGIKVPKDTYAKAIDYFLKGQEASGPEVASFSIPGADLSFAELKKVEKELREKIRKIEADFKGKKAGGTNKAGHTEKDELDVVKREASEKAFKTSEKPKQLHARGWSYQPGGDEDWKTRTTGSMTTSGLAALLVCKGQLDGTPAFDKQRDAVNTAIRDGFAWMAANFTVENNPGVASTVAQHHYYYMYGLERAGMIGLVEKFGDKDWYAEGSSMFLGAQEEDGSFNARGKGTCGPVVDTCFALLFLSKGTTPIVRLPSRTATGPGSEGK